VLSDGTRKSSSPVEYPDHVIEINPSGSRESYPSSTYPRSPQKAKVLNPSAYLQRDLLSEEVKKARKPIESGGKLQEFGVSALGNTHRSNVKSDSTLNPSQSKESYIRGAIRDGMLYRIPQEEVENPEDRSSDESSEYLPPDQYVKRNKGSPFKKLMKELESNDRDEEEERGKGGKKRPNSRFSKLVNRLEKGNSESEEGVKLSDISLSDDRV